MFEQENWFIFGSFRQGMDGWEIGLDNGDQAAASWLDSVQSGREPLRIDKQSDGLHVEVFTDSSVVVLRQPLPDLPGNRQAVMRTRIRILEGTARAWVRFYDRTGADIAGSHQWSPPYAHPSPDWQVVEFDFVVPGSVVRALAGVAFSAHTRAIVAACEFRLVDDALEAYRQRLLWKIDTSFPMLDDQVRDAFEHVPRHLFLPDITPAAAYMDDAIATRFVESEGSRIAVSSSSQPTMMALMLADLDLRPGMRVLEIGAGTGYNAALLAKIVGVENVTSIDIDPEIVESASANLKVAGLAGMDIRAADGWAGCPDSAPFDRIIVTVGVPDIAPAWFDQLVNGGVIVMPLSVQCVEFSVAFRKTQDRLRTSIVRACSFMDLRGTNERIMVRRHNGAIVRHDSLTDETTAALADAIRKPHSNLNASIAPGEQLGDYVQYLSLRHQPTVAISAPELRRFDLSASGFVYAIVDPEDLSIACLQGVFGQPRIGVRLTQLGAEWNAIGRPSVDRLRLTAYPRSLHQQRPRVRNTPSRGIVEKPNAWLVWEYGVN